MTATDLMRQEWIKCEDIPLSIFETAGNLFRSNSTDGRAIMNYTQQHEAEREVRSQSKAEGFNRSLAKLHIKAVDHLKGMGFSGKAIDESLRTNERNGDRLVTGTTLQLSQKQVARAYQEQIDVNLRNMVKK